MRDGDDRSLVGAQRGLEVLAALDVEVVERLVEEQQIAAAQDQQR